MTEEHPVVGMVGGGQLARMTWPAVADLGIELRVLAAHADDSAAQVLPTVTIGSLELDDLRAFAAGCDVVTFDHELVDPEALSALEAEGHLLRPSREALRFAQDKAHQRIAFDRVGLPVPDFFVAQDRVEAEAFADKHGWPVVVKATRGGYDGRGVWLVRDARTLADAWAAAGTPVLIEEAVPLERELAVLISRGADSRRVSYPLVETVQRDGILVELLVPARVSSAVAARAIQLGEQVAEAIEAVGTCAVELFWTGERLLVNEVATRPHNSGHWTIEGTRTSQFANHVRAVLGWPLGGVQPVAPAACTVNVLGRSRRDRPAARVPAALAVPGVGVHLYGKQARPGRKLGHVTALGEDLDEAREHAWRAARILTDEEA